MAKEIGMEGRGLWSPWRILGWGTAAALLLLPLVAMQFTEEVRWDETDFLFAGVMFGSVGIAFEFAVRSTRSIVYRVGVAALLAAGFLLIWINLAVGIIGDEDNPLNLLYGGVILIAFAGAIGAGFRTEGMARAMIAAAVAQALVGVVAVIAGANEPPGPAGLVILNGFFVALFLLAAVLFRRARHEAVDR